MNNWFLVFNKQCDHKNFDSLAKTVPYLLSVSPRYPNKNCEVGIFRREDRQNYLRRLSIFFFKVQFYVSNSPVDIGHRRDGLRFGQDTGDGGKDTAEFGGGQDTAESRPPTTL